MRAVELVIFIRDDLFILLGLLMDRLVVNEWTEPKKGTRRVLSKECDDLR